MTYEEKGPVSQATGLICLDGQPITSDLSRKHQDLEALAPRNWYDRFVKVGLNFAPAFRH